MCLFGAIHVNIKSKCLIILEQHTDILEYIVYIIYQYNSSKQANQTV